MASYGFWNKLLWIVRILIAWYSLQIVLYNSGLLPTTIDSNLYDVSNIIKNQTNFFESVTINEFTNYAYFYTNHKLMNDTLVYRVSVSKHADFGNKLNDIASFPIHYTDSKSIVSYVTDILIYWIIAWVIWNLFIFFVSRYILNNLTNISVTNLLNKDGQTFKLVTPDKNGIKFKDVIGHKEGKQDLVDCVKFFEHRDKYVKTGYEIPKGLLLVGSPGTGKTLLAKAFANEANVNFISVCGSDFIELYVGVGSKRVRELFELARANSPCIIFIDEIDAIGSKRSSQSHGHNEHGSTLNKLLSEIDGFTSSQGIMVVGATNRIETLDDALLRSGRFDKHIFFDPPNLDERRELFKLFVSKIQLDNVFKNDIDDNLNKLARATAGLTGADIKNICNQSVRIFMNRIDVNSDEFNTSGVIYQDLASAIDVVMIGIEKPERKMTEKEREIVSYHEAGHSLIAYVLKDTDVPIKVSIIPRGQSALGFSQQEPSDRKIHTKSELLARLCVLLGGRQAEKLMFNHYSTGASDDIEKATTLAYSMVSNYGMIDDVGPFNPNKVSKYISDDLKERLDTGAQDLLFWAQENTDKYLALHKEELNDIAKFLLDREVLLADDMDNILMKYNIKNKYSL